MGRARVAAEGVYFVDENNAGREFASASEKPPHTRGADTRELLLETRPGNGKKRNAGFTGSRTRQQSLACSRWSIQQNAARSPSAEASKANRIAQEFDCFRQLSFGFVNTGHVGERRFLLIALIIKAETSAATIDRRVHTPADNCEHQHNQDRPRIHEGSAGKSRLCRSELNRYVGLSEQLDDRLPERFAGHDRPKHCSVGARHDQRVTLDYDKRGRTTLRDRVRFGISYCLNRGSSASITND